MIARRRPTTRSTLTAFAAALALSAPMALSPTLGPSGGEAHARAPMASYADLIEEIKPAVVTISIRQGAGGGFAGARPEIPDGPLGDFFRRFFEDNGRTIPRRGPRNSRGVGSGFIIDASGVVVTNHHVIDNASTITVILDDGREYEAKLLGSDDKTDVAVLKVETDAPLPTVSWADSEVVRVGDPVLAIGNPFGLGGTVTTGIVSARGRDINAGPYDDFIQVDAAINRGNSGGPLFNDNGGVIGVNTAIISPSGGNIGLGFAIPANQARAVARQILENGFVERGFISVSIQPVTEEIAESLGLDEDKGALVANVTPGGPADRAGPQRGDVILAFAGSVIGEVRDLTRAVAATQPGASRKLTVWRDGAQRSLTVKVGRMEGAETASADDTGFAPTPRGAEVSLDDLGLKLSRDRGEGVLIAAVEPLSPAADKDLRPGDRILEVNQRAVSSPSDVADAVDAARKSKRSAALLMIERGDKQHFVGLTLKR